MKSYAVLILLFVCLAAGILLHASNKKQTELDKVTVALQGAKTYLNKTNALSIKVEPTKTEFLLYPRYILAPKKLDTSGKYDTTLTLRFLTGGDTSLSTFLAQRYIIWQHYDDRYHYSLSTSRR